jgi:RimJ/RimL family protein N-acetyltransferase
MSSADIPLLGAFLRGPRIHLRALRPEDAEGDYPNWLNDAEICSGNSHHVFPYSAAAALDYIEYARKARDCLILAIVDSADQRHIGNIALQNIHPVYRSAELSILLGGASARGQGIGLEAALLLCRHGFDALNLQRIACGTFADNRAMCSLAKKLGMAQEGVRRQAAFKHGAYLDVVEFGMLREEFFLVHGHS